MILALACSAPAGVHAAELTGLAGGVDADAPGSLTYSWQLEYRQPVTDSFSASFSWLNEGHFTDNHRDGQALQVWWRSNPSLQGLSFSLGAGPYAYYNTTRVGPNSRFEDAHGFALLTSAEAEWYFANGFVTSLRLNRVDAVRSFSSTAILAGLGYRFDDNPLLDAAPATDWNAPFRVELDGFLGKTVRNSFRSPDAATEGLGVRTQLSDHVSASLSVLNAEGAHLGWDTATVLQVWLGANLTHDVRVEAGLGGLFPIDQSTVDGHSSTLDPSGVVAISGAYSLSQHWVARFVWDRVGTGDSRDADIVLFNLGYRF